MIKKYICKHCKECVFWDNKTKNCDAPFDALGILDYVKNNGCTAISVNVKYEKTSKRCINKKLTRAK